MTKDNDIIKDKAQVYFVRHISVHIRKNDGQWLNGFIDEVSDEFLMLDEFKLGKTPVFFREIETIETYTKGVEK